MSEISDKVLEMTSPADLATLHCVRHLLHDLPNEVRPWMTAIGETVHKSAASKLSKVFDGALPGLFAFPMPERKIRLRGTARAVVVPNVVSESRLLEVLQKISVHSPKLSFADADKNSPIPLDRPHTFQDSDVLIGAHSLPSDECLDFCGNANLLAIYKQVKHVVRNKGSYALPTGLTLQDFSSEIATYIGLLEHVVNSEALFASRDVAVIPGLPQILLPLDEFDGGYLCITPLACGGVMAAVSDSIKSFSFEQNDAKIRGEERKGLHTSSCMPMVGNKQNLSGLIGRVKRIYFSAPPLIDKEARSAHTLAHRSDKWARQELQKLVRSKDDPAIRHALKNIRIHVEEILSRSEKNDPTVLDATTPNERAYEINAIRFLARPLICRWLELSKEHEDQFEGTKSDLKTFDVAECGEVILQAVSSSVGIAVSPHTLSVWREEIFCEIHENLKRQREGNVCG